MADTIIDRSYDEGVETESMNVDGPEINPAAESSLSLASDAQIETTESTRSLVHRDVTDGNSREVTKDDTEEEVVQNATKTEREKSPESDTTAAPSIGPVVLRDIKKRKKLQRTCA